MFFRKEVGMYLLVIVLHREEFLEDVLAVLVELGVTDATVIDSESMGAVLAYKVPIFAGLRFDLKGGRRYSKTIFALVEDKEIGDQVVHLLKETDVDLEIPGTGMVITIKVESALGTPSELTLD